MDLKQLEARANDRYEAACQAAKAQLEKDRDNIRGVEALLDGQASEDGDAAPKQRKRRAKRTPRSDNGAPPAGSDKIAEYLKDHEWRTRTEIETGTGLPTPRVKVLLVSPWGKKHVQRRGNRTNMTYQIP